MCLFSSYNLRRGKGAIDEDVSGSDELINGKLLSHIIRRNVFEEKLRRHLPFLVGLIFTTKFSCMKFSGRTIS